MNTVESALSCFDKGFVCSQAVLSSYAKQYDLAPDLAMKISSAFGGGMARTASTCGAVTGAFMVIGLKFGPVFDEGKNDKLAKEKTYQVVNTFVRRFKELNRSIICKELLGADISTPEGLKAAEDNKLYDTACTGFIKYAIEILDELLIE